MLTICDVCKEEVDDVETHCSNVTGKKMATCVECGIPPTWTECDGCGECTEDAFVHIHYGSMRKEMHLCPECDLPEGWVGKWSQRRHLPYFFNVKQKSVQWSHPTPGNPLYKSGDVGEPTRKKQKKKSRASLNQCHGPVD